MEFKKKQIYGLIGYPIKHSFSAAMHNAAFSYLAMNAEYKLFEINPQDLQYFFHRIIPLRDIKGETIPFDALRGFNVTIPHKEAVLQFLNKISPAAAEIKAVNTVSVHNGSEFKGFNTDFAGFDRHISELDVNTEKAAIIGAGGAARAVAYALKTKQTEEIAIYDIDKAKAESLAKAVNSWDSGCAAYAVELIEDLNLHAKTLLVNASPVGMREDDPLLITRQMLHKDLFVYDLIYNPVYTKLLLLAQDNGLRHRNGLKMLLYQGVLAFEHWIGIDAPLEIMFEALKGEMKKCQG
ncbi:MAG: shikimate dehydrogenase [Candidatus Omnitrophica bacterium]|nr:shikimate dehydrogenase [Candidatus Omnitrophota bacterium]